MGLWIDTKEGLLYNRVLQNADRLDGTYTLEGKKLTSVTEIMSALAKPALLNWAAKQAALAIFGDPHTFDTVAKAVAAHTTTKGEAADRGKAVHSLIEAWASGQLEDMPLPPGLDGYGVAFRKFVRTWRPQTLYTECVVRNLTHGYAGRMDWIGEIGSERFMLDFKTSKAVWVDQGLQVSAYKNAEEMRPGPRGTPFIPMPQVDHQAVVLIHGDGNFDMKIVDEPFEVFLALKKVYEWWKGK